MTECSAYGLRRPLRLMATHRTVTLHGEVCLCGLNPEPRHWALSPKNASAVMWQRHMHFLPLIALIRLKQLSLLSVLVTNPHFRP